MTAAMPLIVRGGVQFHASSSLSYHSWRLHCHPVFPFHKDAPKLPGQDCQFWGLYYGTICNSPAIAGLASRVS
jgi:hypothetical protein